VSWRAILIAVVSAFVALILVLLCLENEYRRQIRLSPFALFILYLPLLVPQIAFLSGLSVLFLWHGWDGHFWSVAFAHLIFVMPYTYLLLADPWHSFDSRYLAVGRTLGKSPWQVLLLIRLPILLRPILTAFALGFAISIAQYLPTLLIGAGRLPTITTEAVALASGGNRRLIGVYALVQTLLPFVAFALTALLPAYLWRNRASLRPGTI
jgi:putative thiamine transport system permease protein